MIKYERFWELLEASNETTYTLVNKYNISSHTLNRLKHNKATTTETLDKLCNILKCRIEDLVEHIPD